MLLGASWNPGSALASEILTRTKPLIQQPFIASVPLNYGYCLPQTTSPKRSAGNKRNHSWQYEIQAFWKRAPDFGLVPMVAAVWGVTVDGRALSLSLLSLSLLLCNTHSMYCETLSLKEMNKFLLKKTFKELYPSVFA